MRSTRELIAAAETHLDASDQSQFSTANGIELLTALKREHATVAALRKALEDARECLSNLHKCDEGAIEMYGTFNAPELLARIDAALALRDPAGKET